jgi:hypothetical protein
MKCPICHLNSIHPNNYYLNLCNCDRGNNYDPMFISNDDVENIKEMNRGYEEYVY